MDELSDFNLAAPQEGTGAVSLQRARRLLWGRYLLEWLVIVAVAVLYGRATLLDFDPRKMQQTGEHNEAATLPLLAEIGLRRYGEIPLWNPYMQTGFPHAGDLVYHFWHPISTLSIWAFGGIVGIKVSVFISLVAAGIGQWWFAHVFGVRGFARVWAGILFMLSGGVGLLWRVGWYWLLLGIAWFPWCFASLWRALRKRDRASLGVAALCVALVLTTGGGYYPFYLVVSMAVLVAVALLFARASDRRRKFRRAVAIAVLGAGLTAALIVPTIDGYRLIQREVLPDLQQRASQPMTYALINYVVSHPDWYRSELLGAGGGYNWFYIGYLPFLALLFTPAAAKAAPWRRPAIVATGVLALVIVAWHANRHTPVQYLYDWIPFLYNLRFPNRLLVLAASPLIVAGAYGLQYVIDASLRWGTRFSIRLDENGAGDGSPLRVPLRWFLVAAWLLVIGLSLRDVYKVNKEFTFNSIPLNQHAYDALTWLKAHDPDFYYTDIGAGPVLWSWLPAAYDLEMPVINFVYGRRLVDFVAQRTSGAPFYAQAKYIIAPPGYPVPATAELLRDFEGLGLWHVSDALPVAFSLAPERLAAAAAVEANAVVQLDVRLDGPNRVVVRGEPTQPGDRLVVLVNDYPGWRLFVDGQPAEVVATNAYLGATMLAGNHTYEFAFRPAKHYIGLGISLASLVIVIGILLSDLPWWPLRLRAKFGIAAGIPRIRPTDAAGTS